ncbi:hypothetical protein BaRGS_00024868, partial [Batillaria attramentaria]
MSDILSITSTLQQGFGKKARYFDQERDLVQLLEVLGTDEWLAFVGQFLLNNSDGKSVGQNYFLRTMRTWNLQGHSVLPMAEFFSVSPTEEDTLAFGLDEKDLDQAERMRSRGEQLMMEDQYAVDSIRPKCVELQRMCEQYKDLLRRRRQLLTKSHDLHDRLDRANRWCSRGVDLLASQPIERCQTSQGAEASLQEIEAYLKMARDLKLSNPREFRQLFDEIMTQEIKGTVQQVLKRMEDVQSMCEKRKESLRRMCDPRPRPVHVAVSDTSSDIPMASDGTQRSSLSSMSLSSLPEMDILQAKRRHVMNELIETEKAYVTELQEILKGYYKEMDSRTMQHLIPQELTGQKHALFGNLEQIYKFHHDVFLQELQDCRDYPAIVGKCFVKRKEEFQMYSIYCQNKPKSEAIRMRVGDSNPFFKECQRKLGHKLPLGAYLLKPVQRITKYQLLLKEMLRFTGDDRELEGQLQEALDCMLSVLQYLNASMHQVHIVGFNENMADLGRLLLHGGFSVWTEHKQRIKDLRFKPMQRHIFLYERGLLLCKKKEEGSEDPIYTFKSKLKLSQVGLTERLKGDKRKFELWSRGREEVYIIQAPSMEVKEIWVKAIKRVLMNQFDQIRSHHRTHIPMVTDEGGMTSSQLSSDSSDYSPPANPIFPHSIPHTHHHHVGGGRGEEGEEEGWSSGEFSNDEENAAEEFAPGFE